MSGESPIHWQDLNLEEDEASVQGTKALRFMIEKIHQAQYNPNLRPTVQSLFKAHELVLIPEERAERLPLSQGNHVDELTTERGNNRETDPPQRRSSRSPRPARRPLEREPPSEDERSSKRRQPSSSPSPNPTHRRGSERGRTHARRRRSPSPSSSPSSSSTSDKTSSEEVEHARRTNGRRVRPQRAWKRAQKFKEGGKNVTFLTYDGSYGQVDKVLNFIQQFDAAFGGENFTESSKLRHMSMYLQKSARKWWASLKTKGIQPRSWKRCRLEIMKQFLPGNVKDDVLTAWRGLTYEKGDNIQKYVDKFWDLHLKASVFKDIDFDEQRQQFCAGLPEDVRAYVNDQKPESIAAVIHRSFVGMKIFMTGKSFPTSQDKSEKASYKEQAQKDPKGSTNERRKRRSHTKDPIDFLQRSWKSIRRIIVASGAVRRVMHTVLALKSNKRKILRKQPKYIFLQELLIPQLNCALRGEKSGIKTLLFYLILALLTILSQLNLHRS